MEPQANATPSPSKRSTARRASISENSINQQTQSPFPSLDPTSPLHSNSTSASASKHRSSHSSVPAPINSDPLPEPSSDLPTPSPTASLLSTALPEPQPSTNHQDTSLSDSPRRSRQPLPTREASKRKRTSSKEPAGNSEGAPAESSERPTKRKATEPSSGNLRGQEGGESVGLGRELRRSTRASNRFHNSTFTSITSSSANQASASQSGNPISANQTTTSLPPPSAKSLGKRRAISPPAPPSPSSLQTDLSPSDISTGRKPKRRKTSGAFGASANSPDHPPLTTYNLRSKPTLSLEGSNVLPQPPTSSSSASTPLNLPTPVSLPPVSSHAYNGATESSPKGKGKRLTISSGKSKLTTAPKDKKGKKKMATTGGTTSPKKTRSAKSSRDTHDMDLDPVGQGTAINTSAVDGNECALGEGSKSTGGRKKTRGKKKQSGLDGEGHKDEQDGQGGLVMRDGENEEAEDRAGEDDEEEEEAEDVDEGLGGGEAGVDGDEDEDHAAQNDEGGSGSHSRDDPLSLLGLSSDSPSASAALARLTAPGGPLHGIPSGVLDAATLTQAGLALGLGGGRSGGGGGLRAYQSMFGSGYSSRLREILPILKGSDISTKASALQELSEILSVSTEDNLSGSMQVESFIKELVRVLKGDFGPAPGSGNYSGAGRDYDDDDGTEDEDGDQDHDNEDDEDDHEEDEEGEGDDDEGEGGDGGDGDGDEGSEARARSHGPAPASDEIMRDETPAEVRDIAPAPTASADREPEQSGAGNPDTEAHEGRRDDAMDEAGFHPAHDDNHAGGLPAGLALPPGVGGEGELTAEDLAAFGFADFDDDGGGSGGLGGGFGFGGGGGQDEMMLVACRCLANLMEALPGTGHSVVYAGAVPVLCAKLTNITYIELAEQTISTMAKLSEEVPHTIVREDGLAAILANLDFHAMSVQRTALEAIANCCRHTSHDSFPMIRDIMPKLGEILRYPDQKLVEHCCHAVTYACESYQYHPEKLEALLTPDILRGLSALLVPGASTISTSTYAGVLKMLSVAAKSSPEVSTSLIDMDIANTVYHVLTGVPPPPVNAAQGEIVLTREDDNMLVMQNLAHRPKERVQETLNLICELLPSLPKEGIFDSKSLGKDKSRQVKIKREEVSPGLASEPANAIPAASDGPSEQIQVKTEEVTPGPPESAPSASKTKRNVTGKEAAIERRVQLLMQQEETRTRAVNHFYTLLLPTMVEVYAATVSAPIRSKVVLALLKMINYSDVDHLNKVLHNVSMASLLASILSTRDQPALATSALQMVELLLEKMPDAYHLVFRKEGVMHEIDQLADQPLITVKSKRSAPHKSSSESLANGSSSSTAQPAIPPSLANLSSTEQQARDLVSLRARHVRKKYIAADSAPALKARAAMDAVRSLVDQLLALSSYSSSSTTLESDCRSVLLSIVGLFTQEITMSSFELLESGLVDALLAFSTSSSEALPLSSRQSLLGDALLGFDENATGNAAFALLVKRLQDALSRLEQFEVATVSASPSDDRRSSATMITRSCKIRLLPEGDFPPTIAATYSIQAVATFDAFIQYLRPKLVGRSSRLSTIMAAFAAAGRSPGGSPFDSPSARLPQSNTTEAQSSSLSSTSKVEKKDEGLTRRRSSRLKAKNSIGSADTPSTSKDKIEDPPKEADGDPSTQTEVIEDADPDETVESIEDQFRTGSAPEERPMNLRVNSDGSKMELTTPDGTRVGTPRASAQPASSSAAPLEPATPASTSAKPRASYAAALKAEPTDYHIEFMLDGHVIPFSTTIYSALHQYESRHGPSLSRNIWTHPYPVTMRKVPGPRPTDTASPEPVHTKSNGLPDSVPEDSRQAKILLLLRVLYDLNAGWNETVHSDRTSVALHRNPSLPDVLFVNNKLTAKLNRQLEEHLIVASACLPDWALDLPQHFLFLFPFETRHRFMTSTSFGYSRVMERLVRQARQENPRNENAGNLGQLQRQKVRISRSKVLESAFKVVENYGSSRAQLEVEFFEEVGTGLGPTLEFYALVCREFSRKDLRMWREGEESPSAFVHNPTGLFPAPMSNSFTETEGGKKRLTMFRILGQFVAKAIVDGRTIDISFAAPFMKLALDRELPLSVRSVKLIDPSFGRSLEHLGRYLQPEKRDLEETKSEVAGLALDFTLPNYGFPLKADGHKISVDIDNLQEYIDLCVDWSVRKGIVRQVGAWRQGFSLCFPVRDLQSFTAEELVMLFGCADEDWSFTTIHDNIIADHGYTADSRVVNDFITVMSEFELEERRTFLSFITGSPRLPIGGFAALNPKLTIVRKPPEDARQSDEYLVSVMTCVQYVKLPEYSSKEVLKQRLQTAMNEGLSSFHLS